MLFASRVALSGVKLSIEYHLIALNVQLNIFLAIHGRILYKILDGKSHRSSDILMYNVYTQLKEKLTLKQSDTRMLYRLSSPTTDTLFVLFY